MDIQGMLFVGFNKRVAALDRDSGNIVWQWTAPDGTGFVALLLDGDRLFASVNGYTYCLDPLNGNQLWANPMKGFGHGTATLATVRGHSSHAILGEAARQAAARRSAAAGS